MNLKFQNTNSPTFELVLSERDFQGNPTNKTKSFKTNEASDLERFFIRYSGKPKKKKKRRKVDAAKKEDVAKIVEDVNKYHDKKEKAKETSEK